MINVLQIGMTRNHGGLETYLLEQWRYLEGSDIHYDFVNITGEYPIVAEKQIKEAGSKVYTVCSRHKNPIKHYYQWYKLLKKIAYNYHAIVLNTNTLEYVYPLLIARLLKIPVRVVHAHNAGFGHKIGLPRKVLIFLNHILLRYSATNYFACSKKAGQWMFGDKYKFHVINNAINTEKMRYNLNKRVIERRKLRLDESFVIGHIGAFNYQKNHEFLIDIFAAVYNRNPSARLLLIGDAVDDQSFLKKAKEKVAFYHLEHIVKFLGVRKDVPDLLQAVDCFVLPSHFEGLPLVGIEAQAAGLPCFFSDTITKELDVTSNAHFISLNNTPEQWADEILKHSKSLRRDTSEEIRASGYDIEEEINKIIAFYTRDKNE